MPDEPLAIILSRCAADQSYSCASNWLGTLDEATLPSFTKYECVRYDPL